MDESEIKLVINKSIRAPVNAVYAAWTNPEIIKKWFAPDQSMTVPNAEVDPRAGGSYLIHLHDNKSGSDHIVSGDYAELIRNEKLVFNWKWKDGVDHTQVTIELRTQNDGGTLLTLTHRGFSQQEFADKHNEGWSACLHSLAGCLV